MQTWKKIITKKTLLKHFKAKRKISLNKKKYPEEHLIIVGVYFDNNKAYLGITITDYVLEHTDARDNQE